MAHSRLVPLCVILLVLAVNVPCTALNEEEGGNRQASERLGAERVSESEVLGGLRAELRAASRERPGAEGLLDELVRAVPEMDEEQQEALTRVLQEALGKPGPDGSSRRQAISTFNPQPWLPPDVSIVSPLAGNRYTVILYELPPFVEIDNYQAVPQTGERLDLALLDPGNVNGTRTVENLRLKGLTIEFLQLLEIRLQVVLSFVYPCKASDFVSLERCPQPTRPDAFSMMQQQSDFLGLSPDFCADYKCFVAGAVKVDVNSLSQFAVTQPYMEKGFALVVRASPEQPGFFAWSDAFDQQLWGVIVAELIFCAICFMVCEGYGTNQALWGQGNLLASFFDCLYWAITIILGAADKAPTTHAGRSLVQTQLFFGVLLIALYTGNLASFLSNTPLNIPVVRIQDLFDPVSQSYSPTNKVCYSLNQPSVLQYLRLLGADGSQFELVERRDFAQCVNMVYKGEAQATFYDEPVALALLKDYYSKGMCGTGGQCTDTRYTDEASCICPPEYVLIDGDCQNLFENKWTNVKGSLTITGDIFNPFGYGLAFPRNVNTTDYITFSQAIVWMKDQGRILDLESKYVPSASKLTCATVETANVQLGFENIRGLLTTAAVIMFIGVIIALFENTIRAAIFLLPCFKGKDLEDIGNEAKEKAREAKREHERRASQIALQEKRRASGVTELTEEQMAEAAKDTKEVKLDAAIADIEERLATLVALLEGINETAKVPELDDRSEDVQADGWPPMWIRPVLKIFGWRD